MRYHPSQAIAVDTFLRYETLQCRMHVFPAASVTAVDAFIYFVSAAGGCTAGQYYSGSSCAGVPAGVCMCVRVYACVCLCVYVCACVNMCVQVCACVRVGGSVDQR